MKILCSDERNEAMKLFTVGPVEMYEHTLQIAGTQVPYFRNESFSRAFLECERLFRKSLGCEEDGPQRLIMLTSSGTGAMEAAVMNCLSSEDNAIVVNGGTFGKRFVELLVRHGVPSTVVEVPVKSDLTEEMLEASYDGSQTALLVNLDETSLGKLYDIEMLAGFCKAHNLLFVVDAVSAFLCDKIDMESAGIDVLLTGSQKALSLQPGLSLLMLSERAQERVSKTDCPCMYFDFKEYLSNGVRGQTPFTPAVGIAYELLDMLRTIDKVGVASIVSDMHERAEDFRDRINAAGLPLSVPGYSLSNALTPIVFDRGGATDCRFELERRFGFVVNPCGGEAADRMLRIAHMGNHTIDDNRQMVEALVAVLA